MSGHTGKMTAAAIDARGPRMVLTQVNRLAGHPHGPKEGIGWVVSLEGKSPFNIPPTKAGWSLDSWELVRYAKSYTLSYLLRIGGCLIEIENSIY